MEKEIKKPSEIFGVKVWFTSDSHIQHRNILKHCPKRAEIGGFDIDDVEAHDKWLIDIWNKTIGKRDIVYILGDFSFASPEIIKKQILPKLNGQKYLILGNHDKSSEHLQGYFTQITQMKEVVFKRKNFPFIEEDSFRVFMCHYPMVTWPGKHHGVVNAHGHCVDAETDILTCNGWKTYKDLSKNEIVWTYNCNKKVVEQKPIQNVILYPHYHGNVYTTFGRSSMRMTDKHTVLHFNKHKKFFETMANDFFENVKLTKIMTSFDYEHYGIDMTDDEIRLYILLAADGTITKSQLGRLRFKKDRKIEYAEKLLKNMSIHYTKNVLKNKMTYFNFKIPQTILRLNIKGLDREILNMTNNQVDVLLETYINSDGNKNKNGYLIYTSKEEEMNLLQELFVTHGYYCTVNKREGHGFSKKASYTIGVYKNKTDLYIKPTINHIKESVEDEFFWCIEVENHNFFARRHGKVFLTSNCHSHIDDFNEESADLRVDVGIDGKLADFKPISLEKLYHYFKDKTGGKTFEEYVTLQKELGTTQF